VYPSWSCLSLIKIVQKYALPQETYFFCFTWPIYDHLNKTSVKIDPQSSSEYSDVHMGLSEAELPSSEWDQNAEMQRDYWFGKKYLECIVAQDLLQHISFHETVAGIDVRKVFDAIRSSNGDCR